MEALYAVVAGFVVPFAAFTEFEDHQRPVSDSDDDTQYAEPIYSEPNSKEYHEPPRKSK
jgi:hypothetical protein